MDGGAWWAPVHGVAKSLTRLNEFTFIFHFHALEEEMANHSRILAWRIPGTGEPGGLPSMGSHRVGHDWSNAAAAAAAVKFSEKALSHVKKFTSILSLVRVCITDVEYCHLVSVNLLILPYFFFFTLLKWWIVILDFLTFKSLAYPG